MDRLKILVVDDEILVRKSLLKILKRDGIFGEGAEDGLKAVEMAKECRYDIVISDIRMPGIDGIETIRRIKEIHPKIKTIIMTGYANNETPIKAIRLGVNDYIYKPFELEEFRICVQRNIKLIELEQENENLEEKNIKNQQLAAIGSMTSAIVHDVKNALTTIMGFTGIIREEAMDRAKEERFLDMIINQTKSIAEKLQEILEFSRGELIVENKKTLLKEIFEKTISENKDLLEMKRVEFLSSFDEALNDKYIDVDEKRILQVFANLASNSRDAFVNKDNRKIYFSFKEKGNEVMISFRDNGKGIAKEHLEKIFEPFETYGKKHGTGLGLSIVKKIIEGLNGRLELESEEGVGTEFRIYLKLA